VDGVYLARTVGANQDLLDVERIEVLKGPQGTLFGRNTIGGAINVVTERPSDQFGIVAKATGGTRNRRDLELKLNAPLSDSVLTSVAIASRVQDGYQRRIPYPGAQNYVSDPFTWQQIGYDRSSSPQGGRNTVTARGKMLWRMTDSTDVTLTADWSHENETSPATTMTLTSGGPSAFLSNLYNTCIQSTPAQLATFGLSALCGPRAAVGTALAGANAGGSAAGPRLPWGDFGIAYTGDRDTTYADGLNFNVQTSAGGAVIVDTVFSRALELKSITAYRTLSWKAGMDNDGSILAINEPSFGIDDYQVSQEFQLTGKVLNNTLDYAAGLYYFHEYGKTGNWVVLSQGLLQAAPNPGDDWAAYLGTTSYAGYADLSWHVTDKIGITAGARYTKEKKTARGNQADINGFIPKLLGCPTFDPGCLATLGFPVPTEPYRLFPPGDFQLDYSVFTPKAGAEYHFTDDVMSYFTYSKGFKAGGFNQQLTAPYTTAPSFRPEENKSYELGVKSEWFNKRLRLNAAGFIQDYTDIQLLLTLQGAASPLIGNSGNARIKGAELEGTLLITDGLTLSAGGSHLDAYYTKVDPNAEITTNTKLPKTPSWKYFISPSYTFSVPGSGQIRVGADFTHTSSMFNDVADNPYVARDATNILNASASYILRDGNLELTVGGLNITDDRYRISGFLNLAAGAVGANYNAPPEWYASIKARF
jgi:iron complex outermembrane receptor protein